MKKMTKMSRRKKIRNMPGAIFDVKEPNQIDAFLRRSGAWQVHFIGEKKNRCFAIFYIWVGE